MHMNANTVNATCEVCTSSCLLLFEPL